MVNTLHSGPVAAVVFDVGRVLYQWQLRTLFEKLISDGDELDWFLSHVVTEEWHFQHDAGRALAPMVRERQRQFPTHKHLIAAYAERFLETIPGPVPGSIELVERLDANAIALFAITNFGVELWDVFRPTAPVLNRFRDIVVSGRERLAKPDPAIFELAASRFGYRPADLLFIDDNRANVAAAAALGWQTHHFRDAATLESDLTARGLIS